jgi:large repetitive protein
MGNESQPGSFTITVKDTEPPVLSLPADVTIACGNPLPAPWQTLQQFTAAGGSATDNCNPDEISFRLLSETTSSPVCPYILTRTYQATDAAGNTATAEHRIVVEGEGETVQPETEEEVQLKSGMAVFTAVQNGNWNDPATWGEATLYPQAGDDVFTGGYTITVTGTEACNNIEIQTGGSIEISGTNTLQVYGNWTNNGTFTAGTNGNVIFTGTTSPVSISGTNTTIFKNFEIDKGAGNILGVNSNIELDGTITFTSGTMQINNGATVTCTHNAGFTIEADAGMVIAGGTFTSGAFTVTNRGLFQIDSGTANIGTVSGNSFFVGSAGTFRMNNGTLNVAGRLQISGGVAELTEEQLI